MTAGCVPGGLFSLVAFVELRTPFLAIKKSPIEREYAETHGVQIEETFDQGMKEKSEEFQKAGRIYR